MGRADRAAIAAGVPGTDLMEAAGRAAAAAIVERFAAPDQPVAILCGPGNNGGDGYVIARVLAEQGWPVALYALAPAAVGTDAEWAAGRWTATGGAIRPLDDPACEEIIASAGMVVDALFGAGLSRPFGGRAATLLRRLAEQGVPVVAVDTPSGLCGASGRVWGEAAAADLTVTFERPKPGHLLAEGPGLCGELVVAPIGIPEVALAPSAAGAPFLADDPSVFAQGLGKDPAGHKYGCGHAVVVSGGAGATGAARLAARGALRAGAGLVTVAAPGPAIAECAAHLTAIMLRGVDDADALAATLRDLRLNAVALGPGLACGAVADADPGAGARRARALVGAALDSAGFRQGERTVVLDADALTVFADDPEALFARLRPGAAVLTPHLGEFARLFPDLAARLAAEPGEGSRPASKLDVAQEAAGRAGAVILLKGADTVIAAPSGEVAISAAVRERAAPWLATAGSGDVLTGFIAGLAARGFPAFEAAVAGAWLHVEAGREAGPGLIAEDLPEAVPAVLRRALG